MSPQPGLAPRPCPLFTPAPTRLARPALDEPGDDRPRLHEVAAAERPALEQYIRERFDAAFGARVASFMPRLLSLRDAQGLIHGAVGLRLAEQPLFLERYLDAPIEAHISARDGRPCTRRSIVEVGQLSGTYAGAPRLMIMQLTHRLHAEGIRWVAFTGTPALRNAFHRLGLAPVDVAPARAERLPPAEREAWGRYYDDAPRVFFGDVRQGWRRLRPGCGGELGTARGRA